MEITRRLDDRFTLLRDPTSRRPERRRALKSTIQWSYDLLFPDDRRGLWALATFAGGGPLAAVESVLEALEVPSETAIDVVGRLASRSLVIVDDEGSSVRYRVLDSIRAFALEAMGEVSITDRALAAHAQWYGEAAGSSTEGVRSGRQAEHLTFLKSERANIDAALSWAAAHDPSLALEIVNGFGWGWVVLGDSRGAQRIHAALDAGDAGSTKDRASALLLAGWLEASTGHLEHARRDIGVATELADAIGDIGLQARCSYYRAYVVSHQGEWGEAIGLTGRSRAVYERTDRLWDRAANGLFAARAAISAGDVARSNEARAEVEESLRTVDDPWLHVRKDAMLGELARIEHRFDDAVADIGRAAEASRRLGFHQTEAYQVSSLGRAQCQAGDYETGVTTLELAIDKAEATGDVRLAALSASTSDGCSERSARWPGPGQHWRRRRGSTSPQAGASRPPSASACWPRSMPSTGSPGPTSDSRPSSTAPATAMMLPSRSSRSTPSLASPPRPVMTSGPTTAVQRRTVGWRTPPTHHRPRSRRREGGSPDGLRCRQPSGDTQPGSFGDHRHHFGVGSAASRHGCPVR